MPTSESNPYTLVMLHQAFKILERVNETASRNEKLDILIEGKDNNCLKRILYYTYDNYSTYAVRSLEVEYEEPEVLDNETSMRRFHVFFAMLDKLKTRELTGNKAIEALTNFFVDCNEDEGHWYYSTLTRDLDIGATEKTINKVFGKDFIPEFKCMLARPFKYYPKWFVVLFKLDGYRALAFHNEDGTVKLVSRNGKEYLGFDAVETDIKKLARGMVYDGELMSKEKTFSGIQRQGTRKAKGKNATLHVFDGLPIEDFHKGVYKRDWFFRRRRLAREILDKGLENITLVKVFGVFEDKMPDIDIRVDKIYNVALKLRYEGLIVVDVEAPYFGMTASNRKDYWQKLKPDEDFDLEIIGFNEGRGKNTGTLGAIVVDYEGVEVRVGSGISDKATKNPNKYTRQYIWDNKEKLIGHTIRVTADAITDNKTGKPSLRFPRYREFRFDK